MLPKVIWSPLLTPPPVTFCEFVTVVAVADETVVPAGIALGFVKSWTGALTLTAVMPPGKVNTFPTRVLLFVGVPASETSACAPVLKAGAGLKFRVLLPFALALQIMPLIPEYAAVVRL